MRILYNEWDEPTAAWLRELIDGRHLPSGSVDTRSIGDVRAHDLRDFDQCHFFAGIGGWPLALRWAGLEGTPGIWTGSPPCQPFSVAGKGLGQADERHLAPVWLDLIRECKPDLIFGEQVEAAIRVGWLDDLFDALEECGYACGAAVLPACSVGAPHIRKRLFFGAVRLADAYHLRRERQQDQQPAGVCGAVAQAPQCGEKSGDHCTGSCWVADTSSLGRIGRRSSQASYERRSVERSDGLRDVGRLAHTTSAGWRQAGCHTSVDREAHERWARDRHSDGRPYDVGSGMVRTSGTDPAHGFWSGADWLGCRDGKFRPVEPGTQPLLDGISSILGRLRAIEEKTIKGILKHGSPHTRDAKQSLLELRDYLQPKEDWAKQQSRMLFELHEAEVLHSFVLSLLSAQDGSSKRSGFKEANEAPHIRFLRSVRTYGKPFDPSHRRRSDEWGAEQSSDPLLLMSLVLARNVEAYWTEARNAHAASDRVQILRGAGNAIVPQVAAQFITEFLGAIADMQDEGLTP